MHQQHVKCLINTWVLPVKTWLLIACDTGFYAIIKVKMSLHLHSHSTLCMRAANALVSLRISACSPDPLMLSIAIKISLCWHYFMNFLYHVYIEMLTNAYKSSSDRRSGSTCWVSSNSFFLGIFGSCPVGIIASL